MNKTVNAHKSVRSLYIIGSSFLLFSFIGMLGGSIIWRNKLDQRQMEEHILQLSDGTTSYVDDILNAYRASIEVYATLYGTSLESPEVDLELLSRIEAHTSFDWIRFIDHNGKDYASDGTTANCFDREYFQKGIKGESGIDVLDLKPEGYLLKTMPKEKIVSYIDNFFKNYKAL